MTLIETLRQVAARHLRQRQIYAEMAEMSDAEMRDLDLSLAKIAELSRRGARAI